jgi:hypothetical protein
VKGINKPMEELLTGESSSIEYKQEVPKYMKLENREYFRKSVLNPLIKAGLLKLTMPEKLTSPNQRYYHC